MRLVKQARQQSYRTPRPCQFVQAESPWKAMRFHSQGYGHFSLLYPSLILRLLRSGSTLDLLSSPESLLDPTHLPKILTNRSQLDEGNLIGQDDRWAV